MPGSCCIATIRNGNGTTTTHSANDLAKNSTICRKDPDQINNVVGDAAYAAAKKELAERLMKILTDAGDPRVIGDGQTFERSPFVDDVVEKKKKAK